MARRKGDIKLKLLRTYGGGKYTSLVFKHFCKDEGIIHEITHPYTPTHYGARKRKI